MQAEGGVLGGHPGITGQRQLQTASGALAVNRGHGHHWESFESPAGALPPREPPNVGLLIRREVEQIDPGAEGVARAPQDHNRFIGLILEEITHLLELTHHGDVDGVARLGPMKGDRRHTVGALQSDRLVTHLSLLPLRPTAAYQRMRPVSMVTPGPMAMMTPQSPSRTVPSRASSSREKRIDAEEMLP